MAIRGKKGYYFTLTVLIILVVVAVYLKSFADPGYSRNSAVYAQRIVEVNRFVEAVGVDAQAAVYVAAYRALITLDQEKLRKTGYIEEDFDKLFHTLVYNGTLENKNMSLMNISHLGQWERQMALVASRLRLDFSLESVKVKAYQTSPWLVDVRLTAHAIVTDALSESAWNYSINTVAQIPVTELFDPVYTVGSQSRYFQRITRSNISAYPDDIDTETILSKHIAWQFYIPSNASPSYLDRMRGNFTLLGDGFVHTGIESLADVFALQEVDIYHSDTSIVDWQYLEEYGVQRSLCNATSYSWIKIDKQYAGKYNLVC